MSGRKLEPKKFVLVLPQTDNQNDSTATSSDRYQAARKLASTAYRDVYSKTGVTKFEIVIMAKLTREKKKAMNANKDFDKSKLFSAYEVTIKTDSSTYIKDGKKLTSGFKPHIFSLRNTPRSQALVEKAMNAVSHAKASADHA